MVQRISFEDEISKNKIKSFFLILIIAVFFVVLGYVIALLIDPSYFFVIMIFSIIFSLSYTLISYYNSHKIAVASVGAKPASHAHHKMFFDAVENMTLASGLPMPKLYVMPSSQINAFASGRNPQNAIICVTTGALEKLNKQELEGVLAHEMSHIANFDVRFMTLAAVMIGMISIIAEIFLRSLWIGGHSGGNNSGRGGGRGSAVLMVIGILFAVLAPIAANLVALAISRKREFGADATGVKFTRYPAGLANALRKIKGEHVSEQEKHRFPKAVAPLFIADPYRKKFRDLFATHPPIELRIQKLGAM